MLRPMTQEQLNRIARNGALGGALWLVWGRACGSTMLEGSQRNDVRDRGKSPESAKTRTFVRAGRSGNSSNHAHDAAIQRRS